MLSKDEFLKHFEILVSQTDFDSENQVEDYPRMFFILYTYSRLFKKGFIAPDLLLKILKLMSDLYKKTEKLPVEDLMYIELYMLRALKNFGQDLDEVLNNFKQRSHASIYTYPVSAYVFISTYNEVEELKNNFKYANEIYNTCLKCFEFWAFSGNSKNYKSFHFGELGLWRESIPEYLYNKAEELIVEKTNFELANNSISSSGIAKTLEYFARVGEIQKSEEILNFLKKREYKENSGSEYISLDTYAHIIHAFLNSYERKS